jgi:hypothetical protein
MTTIERLETWTYSHKARSVQIERDNGFGATSWSVELHGENKQRVLAYESVEDDYSTDPPHVVRAVSPSGDWGGLDATINAALDHWDRLYKAEPGVAE